VLLFPSNQEYQTAVRNLDSFIVPFAPAFKNGRPRTMKGRNNRLQVYAGGFSRVFAIDVGTKTYALRCWISDVSDVKHKYQEIENYLRQQQLPYFVEFHYIQDGILVQGKKYPIIQMEWAKGDLLKDFIEQSLNRKDVLLETANTFAKMVSKLHVAQISHGDLQHGNIIVDNTQSSIKITLIDYDSLFVPKLAGYPEQIRGLACYQHPSRLNISNPRQATEKADYFSELVIYLSLYALSEKPSLWTSFDVENSDGLLFSQDDIENPNNSKIFQELKGLSIIVNNLTKLLENFCNEPSTDNLIPLEEVISLAQPKLSPSKIITSIFKTPSTPTKSQPITTGKSPSEQMLDSIRNSPIPSSQTKPQNQSPADLLTQAISAIENSAPNSAPIPSNLLQKSIRILHSFQPQQSASDQLREALKTLEQTPQQQIPSNIITQALHTLQNLLPSRLLKKKSLKWTLFLSLITPGMGHIYNGKISIGILTLLITITCYMTLVILGIIVHLFVIVDAIIQNIRRNKSKLCVCCNKHTSYSTSKRGFVFALLLFLFYVVPQAIYSYDRSMYTYNAKCISIIEETKICNSNNICDSQDIEFLCTSCLLYSWEIFIKPLFNN